MRVPERAVSSLQEPVAQPVEHVTFNHGVVGSSPTGLTNLIRLKNFENFRGQKDLENWPW